MLGVAISNAQSPNIHFSAGRKIAGALLSTIVWLAFFTSSQEGARAQDTRPRRVTGILTDRLAPNELRRWAAIERLALARDSNEQPVYPMLYELWNWVEASGHAVYIELPTIKNARNCTAGSFSIEQVDTEGKRHVGAIRLYLNTIDQAMVGPEVARSDGYIPLAGLGKEERYVEVLGHELAHAVYILSDAERTQKVEDWVEQTNELLLSPAVKRAQPLSPWMQQRLLQRDLLLEELEAQAEKVEAVIWSELKRNSSGR